VTGGRTKSAYEDPFGLSSHTAGRHFLVQFGWVNASAALRGGNVKRGLNLRSTVDIDLDVAAATIPLIDYASTVIVSVRESGVEVRQFTGSVVRATPIGENLHLHCQTAPSLTERRISEFSHTAVPGVDLIYTLLRDGGVPKDRMQLDGLDELPVEVFEVAVPVSGVVVTEPVTVGSVRLVPAHAGFAAVRHLAGSPLYNQFTTAGTHAVAYTTASRMLDAEAAGVSEIDSALAWLTVRSRYSLALLPDGSSPTWSRDSMLTSPTRGALVAVRGLRTRRSWLRRPGFTLQQPDIDLGDATTSMLRPPLGHHLAVTRRQALLACARAATDTDPISRVTALWEAVEFYVSDTAVPELFTIEERKAIMKQLPKNPDKPKQDRLVQIFGQLNNPPLLARLRHRLAIDGVPITQEELDLLKLLRDVRNDVAHGRTPDPPSDDDLLQGVAIVARMLVYSAHGPGAS
jgi:hypothetical protein